MTALYHKRLVNFRHLGSRTKSGEVKWAWYRKSRGTWVGPCNHLDTWVGPCDHLNTWVGLSFLELLVIAVQSTANVQKPEVGGAGHVNARHGWGWT